MVHYADRITGMEALAVQRRLVLHLSYKLKWEYSKICCLFLARMSLCIVRYINLSLHGPQDNEAQICQLPELTDGAVMELLGLWHG